MTELRRATGCICGKRMLLADNENVCLWCGHGDAQVVVEHAYRRNMDGPPAAPPAPPAVALALAPLWNEQACIEAARDWERLHGALPTSMDWQQAREPGEARPSYGSIRKVFGGWPGFMAAIADVPREAIAA